MVDLWQHGIAGKPFRNLTKLTVDRQGTPCAESTNQGRFLSSVLRLFCLRPERPVEQRNSTSTHRGSRPDGPETSRKGQHKNGAIRKEKVGVKKFEKLLKSFNVQICEIVFSRNAKRDPNSLN